MTTDAMMTTELMMSANDTDPSPPIIAGIKDAGIKLCYAKMDLPLLPRIILTILLLISVVGHVLVIIVCVRERNKATYKQDIVYMVALAIVDMIFCLSILIMRPSVRNIVALKTLLPLLLCMSLVLMALRAVERFNIFIRKQAKPWSFRFQIILCLVSNLFVAVPINYSNFFTNIPFGFIFWCIVSLIILVSYVTIVCKLLLQGRKSSHTQPTRLFRRQINATTYIDSTLLQHQRSKDRSPLKTATDQYTGPSSRPTNETEITFVRTLQTPNAVMNNHNSLRPDGIVQEKILDQLKNNEVILHVAETNKDIGKKQKEMAIAQASKQLENENIAIVFAETINYPGNEQNEAILEQDIKQLGKGDSDVCFVQTSEKFGKENKQVDLAQKSTQVAKDSRTEVPIHVNRNQISTTRRNKGNHLCRSSSALVFITIIFYLSWFPAWMINISDRLSCYLIFFIVINSTVNPVIYLITLKSFRQASYILLSMLFRRLCKIRLSNI